MTAAVEPVAQPGSPPTAAAVAPAADRAKKAQADASPPQMENSLPNGKHAAPPPAALAEPQAAPAAPASENGHAAGQTLAGADNGSGKGTNAAQQTRRSSSLSASAADFVPTAPAAGKAGKQQPNARCEPHTNGHRSPPAGVAAAEHPASAMYEGAARGCTCAAALPDMELRCCTLISSRAELRALPCRRRWGVLVHLRVLGRRRLERAPAGRERRGLRLPCRGRVRQRGGRLRLPGLLRSGSLLAASTSCCLCASPCRWQFSLRKPPQARPR